MGGREAVIVKKRAKDEAGQWMEKSRWERSQDESGKVAMKRKS